MRRREGMEMNNGDGFVIIKKKDTYVEQCAI